MTVNELIEVLKDTGDEAFRDMATVQICVDGKHGWCWDNIDRFDIKYALNTVDIHIPKM